MKPQVRSQLQPQRTPNRDKAHYYPLLIETVRSIKVLQDNEPFIHRVYLSSGFGQQQTSLLLAATGPANTPWECATTDWLQSQLLVTLGSVASDGPWALFCSSLLCPERVRKHHDQNNNRQRVYLGFWLQRVNMSIMGETLEQAAGSCRGVHSFMCRWKSKQKVAPGFKLSKLTPATRFLLKTKPPRSAPPNWGSGVQVWEPMWDISYLIHCNPLM